MKSNQNFAAGIVALSASVCVMLALPAQAQFQPAQASVRAVHGSATCSIDGKSQPVTESTVLKTGTTIKTTSDATLDLFMPDSRTVLRLMPNSVLRLDRMDKTPAGEVEVTMTKLSLLSGTVIGSQHKLVSPSEFEVALPNGLAKIVGTEYSIGADGTVACLRGKVSVTYNPPDKSSPINVSVPAGFSSNPRTETTTAINKNYLQNIASDIQIVRNNDEKFNASKWPEVVHDSSCDKISPTHGTRDDDHGHDNDHDFGNGRGNHEDGRY